MARAEAGAAVVELNFARRADVFAPLDPGELREVKDNASAEAVIPTDLVEYTTTIIYASGRSEGSVTVRAPRGLIELGPLERAVMTFVCTLYAHGRRDETGAVCFTLHELARFIGWERPNGSQYARLERAVAAVAAVRFVSWYGRLEVVECKTRSGRTKRRWRRGFRHEHLWIC